MKVGVRPSWMRHSSRVWSNMLISQKTEYSELMLGMGAIANRIRELTGHQPARSTLWRWHLAGRLKSRRIGSRLYATDSAIREMLAADEQCNRGGVESRGAAAAARHESRMSGRKSA